jgi:hypothetical protein
LGKVKSKGKGGRPKKEKKADTYFNVYLIGEEKKKLAKYAEVHSTSLSGLIRAILKEKGII